MSIWAATGLDIISGVLREQNQAESPTRLCVSIKNEGVYVNDINIVTKQSTSQYVLLEFFIERFFRSYVMNNGKYEYFSIQELIYELDQTRQLPINYEEQIRRPIRLIQVKASKILRVSEKAFIETLPRRGYRLNPKYVKLG